MNAHSGDRIRTTPPHGPDQMTALALSPNAIRPPVARVGREKSPNELLKPESPEGRLINWALAPSDHLLVALLEEFNQKTRHQQVAVVGGDITDLYLPPDADVLGWIQIAR